ncbi:MAG: acetyl-CoA C-acetyltransferase [Victivallales bacterium]
MRKVFIAGAARTPIGSLNGSLAGTGAVELGRICVSGSLKRAGVDGSAVDEVIIGNVLQAGLGQNPARQIAIGCGVLKKSPSFTVNQVCGSGLKAIDLARRAVMSGDANVVIAGGIESMSGAPYILPALRQGARLGECAALDIVINDGLTDAFGRYHMGVTAENVASKYAVSREAQDRFAFESQRKCKAATGKGVFKEEIVPVTVRQRRTELVVESDEHPRPDSTFENLSKLKPAFKPDGTVTAGNSSGINDGAASVVLFSEDGAPSCTAGKVLVRDIVCVGCEPELMGMGPVAAVRALLSRQKMQIGDIELWELNEAFAAQSVAVLNELGIDAGLVNVNGGAIALGHPVGASGARIVVTLIHQMKRQNAGLGIASLCVGGGMGLAILLENV